MITAELLKDDIEILTLLKLSEKQLEVLGYTEHSFRHVGIVTKRAERILKSIGATEQELELGKIAALMHDLGNAVNRADHAQSGAILAYQILTKKGMSSADAAEVMIAIGNHDEGSGSAVSKISAALIIADKSDVHRSRVRQNKLNENKSLNSQDIHDRVNYAVEKSDVIIDNEKNFIIFEFKVDTAICSAMDYFEIFLERMKMCRESAHFLGYGFKLIINDYNLV